jgi:hypothetical protein
MAKYLGPATDNEAVMIETGSRGRVVPDRYATGDECEKYQDHHAKLIHNDIHAWYGQDTEPSEPW